MKPQNDIELSTALSAIIQRAGSLNRLTSEGRLYEVNEVLAEIGRSVDSAQRRINAIVDMAG